jgi:hypothetical protein
MAQAGIQAKILHRRITVRSIPDAPFSRRLPVFFFDFFADQVANHVRGKSAFLNIGPQ